MLIYIIMSIMYMLHIRKEEIIIISQILNPIENVRGGGRIHNWPIFGTDITNINYSLLTKTDSMSQIHTSPLYHLLNHHDHDLIIKEHLVNKAKQSLSLICNNSVFISYCTSTINNSSAPMMQSRGLQLTFNCSEAVLQLCCILLLD